MATTATDRLASFISEVHDLPLEVTERAKLHVTDTLACIYAGSASRPVEIVAAASAARTSQSGFKVPGLGCWADPAVAALLIGVCAHADDFDDTSEFSMNGHPSAPIVSALIPTAQEVGADGSSFLRAYAVGIEVACKLGIAVGKAHTAKGWHTMSTLGTLAAAGAAAHLRGLDKTQTSRALAIASSFAGGILGNTGTMTKSLHCGRAAQSGYLAAKLAEMDFTAGSEILETPAGFVDAFATGAKTPLVLPPLGEPWELTSTGLAVKLYPACSCTHLAIDGALELRQMADFDVEAIERVDCYVREECTRYLRFEKPETPIQAKFSMHYTVATALLDGKVTLDAFEPSAILRPDVLQTLGKITMIDRADDETKPDIEIIFTDGSRQHRKSSAPRGAPEDPAGWQEISSKLISGYERGNREFIPANITQHVQHLRSLEKVARLSDISQ